MFKFNFGNLEDEDDAVITSEVPQNQHGKVAVQDPAVEKPIQELTTDELMQDLPSVLSYSLLNIPVLPGSSQQETVTLLRRDLFDARYQLISQVDAPGLSKGTNESELESLAFINNPSDLVPGVYEGGLKTWECALDLIDCLSRRRCGENLSGKRTIEIGCGTAVPTLYLLDSHFRNSTQNKEPTEVVFQDYNDLVLRLVTFPNVLLTWCASPLAQEYWSSKPASGEEDDEPFDASKPGDLYITPSLLTAFRSSLSEQNIRLRFLAGSWEALSKNAAIFTNLFDVILTSETIYQTSSLPSLIKLLRQASHADKDSSVEDLARNLSIQDKDVGPLSLVAAKILYFGVGGGVGDFETLVQEAGGEVTTALERNIGVGRKVMRIQWNKVS